MVRRLKELESTLDDHREAIEREARQWVAQIERAAIEQREVLEAFATDKVARLEEAARRQTFAATASGPRMGDLQDAVRAQVALLDQLVSLQATASELDRARALTIEALRRGLEALGRDFLAALRTEPLPVHWRAPPDEPLSG
jgi:hypothetical protein